MFKPRHVCLIEIIINLNSLVISFNAFGCAYKKYLLSHLLVLCIPNCFSYSSEAHSNGHIRRNFITPNLLSKINSFNRRPNSSAEHGFSLSYTLNMDIENDRWAQKQNGIQTRI